MANIDVLVVGGGGGGGSNDAINYCGGGGAGGLIYQTDFNITAGSYTVTVGAGGSTGGNSVFSTLTAIGGGNGAATANSAGSAGGSGGGGTPINGAGGSATSGQGNAGGWGSTSTSGSDSGAGGGGGSAAAGQDVGAGINRNTPGLGGAGTACSITGTSLYYAAGGNGPGYYYGNRPSGIGGGSTGRKPGETGTTIVIDNVPTPNTGSGGAGRTYLGGGYNATIGADGVVIIRYKTSSFGACEGGIITIDGDYTVHKFTSSGTFVCKLKSGSGFFNFF